MNILKKKEHNADSNFIGNLKESFSGRKFRSGVYVTLVSAIIVIIVLVLNLLVTKLDIKIDLSSDKFYTLSDATKKFVKDVKDDITIYYLVESGNEVEEIYRIVENYDKIVPNIELAQKDPVLYPKFVTGYVEDAQVTQNSVLVVDNDNGRAKYIDYSEMLIQETDYQTFSTYTTGLDVEGKITSAIQYVTDPDLPIMYVVDGHQETEIGESFKTSMEKQNVEVKTLSTYTLANIPEDCDVLFINTPKSDLSETEVTIIKEYMANGGDVIITLDYRAYELANFNSLLNYYGVETVGGYIVEGDTNYHFPNYPHYLVPEILEHDITEDTIDNRQYVFTPISSGLVIREGNRSSLTIEPLLETTDKAYSKININATTIEKEEGDIEGPFYIGLIATDTYNNVTSNMVVYSSEYFFEDSTITSYGNGSILTGTVGQLTGKTSSLSIPTKTFNQSSLNTTQGQAFTWAAVVVVVIPAIILAGGIIISLKRRKK